MAINNNLNEKSAGIVVLSSTGSPSAVTITGTSNQISVSNGDGTAGNPTLSLTSNIQVSGISFNSGANSLSNYSTGTFTPTVNTLTTPATVAYTTQIGRYTRIGNRVYSNIYIVLSSYAAGTGQVIVESLPITSSTAANSVSTNAVGLQNITNSVNVLYVVAQVFANVTNVRFQGMRSANTQLVMQPSTPSSTSIFSMSIIYEV